MAADQRDFTRFDEFPGELTGTGFYEFPVITYKNANNRQCAWRMFVRVVKDGKRRTTIDWDPLVESQIDMLPSHINDVNATFPSNSVVQFWTETGLIDGKTTRQAPTYIVVGKNKGRANERNMVQQALIEARSRYLKQLQKSKNIETTENKNVMWFPMLARPWAEGVDHIKYPCSVQRKYDGARCLAYLRTNVDPTADDVVLYSRQKKPFLQLAYLQAALLPLLVRAYTTESLYLDGELYKHGKHLQDISGVARRSVTADKNAMKLDYIVYDCFYPSGDDTFVARQAILDKIFASTYPHVYKAPRYDVADAKELQRRFDQFIEEKYEGAIVRNLDGKYLRNATRTGAFLRSYDVVKMKKRFTDEYKLVGYTSGKGKDTGAIIWICELPSDDADTTTPPKQFNVTPKNIDYPERRALYKKVSTNNTFANEYEGLMMTVEYEDLSSDNIPLRAKAVGVRQL